MKIRELGQQVADDLFAAEAAIDAAISQIGKLTTTVASARLQGNVSAVIGQEVIDNVMATGAGLAAARRSIVETHNGLAAVKDQVGLRTVALGGAFKPAHMSERRTLRRVV